MNYVKSLSFTKEFYKSMSLKCIRGKYFYQILKLFPHGEETLPQNSRAKIPISTLESKFLNVFFVFEVSLEVMNLSFP